jgi:dihydrofolate reductase
MIHNTKISIIAAMDEKRGIGKNNKIPWHIKDDLVKLKNLTKDHVVILGRKTYESMVWYYDKSGRPMPGKVYLVVTRDKDYKPDRDNAAVVHSLEEAFKESRKYYVLSSKYEAKDKKIQNTEHEVFVIGGGQIFQEVLPLANKLYLTIVIGDFHCDTFFPDYSEFKKVISEEPKESEGYKYKFLALEK